MSAVGWVSSWAGCQGPAWLSSGEIDGDQWGIGRLVIHPLTTRHQLECTAFSNDGSRFKNGPQSRFVLTFNSEEALT